MTFIVDATYENGVLKPKQPLPLAEQEKVEVVIRTTSGSLPEMPTPGAGHERREALARLFSLQLPVADWEQMEQEIIRGAVGK